MSVLYRFLLLTITCAGFLILLYPSVGHTGATTSDGPTIKISKAISMHGILNWPKMSIRNGSPKYDWPPFSNSQQALRKEDLEHIKNAGFDTVRLTVGPGIFLSAENEAQKNRLDAILLARAKTIIDSGLNVIVDFHPVTQDPRYLPIDFTRGPKAPTVEKFRELLMRTARNLHTLPANKVVLEILNEPQMKDWSKAETQLWKDTQQSYYKSIRQVAPHLTLMVTGCCTERALDLTTLDPNDFPDRNTLYTFHFYAPHVFTHQGIKEAKSPSPLSPANFIGDIPFPLNEEQLSSIRKRAYEAFDQASTGTNLLDRIKARKHLETVLNRLSRSATPQGIDDMIQKTADWANKYNIPQNRIFIGEFGVMRAVETQSRKNWLKAVVTAAEKRGMGWGYWSFEQPEYMGIIKSRKDRTLDPTTLEALGLHGF